MKIFLAVFVILWSINSYDDLAKAKSCNANKEDEFKLLLIEEILKRLINFKSKCITKNGLTFFLVTILVTKI